MYEIAGGICIGLGIIMGMVLLLRGAGVLMEFIRWGPGELSEEEQDRELFERRARRRERFAEWEADARSEGVSEDDDIEGAAAESDPIEPHGGFETNRERFRREDVAAPVMQTRWQAAAAAEGSEGLGTLSAVDGDRSDGFGSALRGS